MLLSDGKVQDIPPVEVKSLPGANKPALIGGLVEDLVKKVVAE